MWYLASGSSEKVQVCVYGCMVPVPTPRAEEEGEELGQSEAVESVRKHAAVLFTVVFPSGGVGWAAMLRAKMSFLLGGGARKGFTGWVVCVCARTCAHVY